MRRLKKLNFIMLTLGITFIYLMLFSFSTISAITADAVETIFDSNGELGSVIIDNRLQCIEETVIWQEQVPVYGYVERVREIYGICHKEFLENSTSADVSCVTGTEEYQSYEIISYNTEQKSKTVCKQDTSDLDLSIGDSKITLNYGLQGFKCVNQENKIICDSKNDGNGDGVCQSGESCATFDIQNDKVLLTYVNSGKKQNCIDTVIKDVPFTICTDESAIINKLEVRQ
jgi:hypothetical protein